MKATIYINRHVAAANKKHGKNDPCISINTYKKIEYCHKVEVKNCYIIQDPENARCSGATIWIECQYDDITILE